MAHAQRRSRFLTGSRGIRTPGGRGGLVSSIGSGRRKRTAGSTALRMPAQELLRMKANEQEAYTAQRSPLAQPVEGHAVSNWAHAASQNGIPAQHAMLGHRQMYHRGGHISQHLSQASGSIPAYSQQNVLPGFLQPAFSQQPQPTGSQLALENAGYVPTASLSPAHFLSGSLPHNERGFTQSFSAQEQAVSDFDYDAAACLGEGQQDSIGEHFSVPQELQFSQSAHGGACSQYGPQQGYDGASMPPGSHYDQAQPGGYDAVQSGYQEADEAHPQGGFQEATADGHPPGGGYQQVLSFRPGEAGQDGAMALQLQQSIFRDKPHGGGGGPPELPSGLVLREVPVAPVSCPGGDAPLLQNQVDEADRLLEEAFFD
mmetsp:Transcript_35993/g.107598  ORF Transcript_35993/g.107598 Transcript_35993/m.107598 type:complete len:372 (+) Transcript_35993:2570-3685(+)